MNSVRILNPILKKYTSEITNDCLNQIHEGLTIEDVHTLLDFILYYGIGMCALPIKDPSKFFELITAIKENPDAVKAFEEVSKTLDDFLSDFPLSEVVGTIKSNEGGEEVKGDTND